MHINVKIDSDVGNPAKKLQNNLSKIHGWETEFNLGG